METKRSPARRPLRYLLAAVLLAALGAGGWFAATHGKPAAGRGPARDEAKAAPPVGVEVVSPKPGGVQRTSVQPGTVEPFEAADLYAKASGFLAEQTVDIGSRVKAGDVLARLSVPEYEKLVQRDKAKVKNADARVKQMEAHLSAARAEARAADATVALAKVTVRAKAAFRMYREKQLERVKGLAAQNAVEARLVEEQEDFNLSAVEAENAAREGVVSAQERASAARAKIEQAEADLDEARSEVGVATADLEKSQVLLDYTVIRSPYTGVVTKRSFHPGGFVKSADQGGVVPVLAVERTDVMRVVVQVPDRDVPFVDPGDPAVVEIDALPGVVFQTAGADVVAVSRKASAEDAATRTMRTEVDVKNPDGALSHGMYGRVTLILSGGSPTAVRVPSAALVGKAEGGRGSVRVVRGDKVRVVPVRYTTDNGLEVEVVGGLTPADRVVVRAAGPVEDGTAVAVGTDAPGH